MLRKIVEFIDPKSGDMILEIGAGTGALTSPIAPLAEKVIAVELDAELLPYLQAIPHTTILHSDIRQIEICKLVPGKRIRVAGNLPYYISSNVLTWLILHRECISDMTLMFQDEVAHRITATPGDSEYGFLSVIAQYYCEIKKGFKINKNCFVPKPDIESRILRFKFREGRRFEFPEYSEFLEKAFSQRRKKLRNNLLRTMDLPADKLDTIFAQLELAPDVRAENLSAQQYEDLLGTLYDGGQSALSDKG